MLRLNLDARIVRKGSLPPGIRPVELRPVAHPEHFRSLSRCELWQQIDVGDGWVAAFRLSREGRRMVVAELRVFPNHWGNEPTQRPPGEWSGAYSSTLTMAVPSGGIRAGLIRSIPFGPGLVIAERELDRLIEQSNGTENATFFRELLGPTDAAEPAKARGRGRRPVPELELAKAALAYSEAIKARRPPLAAVARALRISTVLARTRVFQAKERGLLSRPPGSGFGVPGGELTARAKALLKKKGGTR